MMVHVAKGDPKQRVSGAILPEVIARLTSEYPEVECALVHTNPYELLVATILSAQCTDARVNLVTPGVFAKYPSPWDMSQASLLELETLIRSTGFYHAKAQSLIGMAQGIETRFGGIIPSTMVELIQLPGVGRKTANVILGNAFHIPGFPVDTHVIRLCNILGFVKTKDAVAIEKEITAVVDPSEWTALSLRLIAHGRTVCIARRPQCTKCVLSDICPSAKL